MTQDYSSVGRNIRKIRVEHNLTQEEMGKIAGVSAMAVSQWENGRAVPRMGAVQLISDYFNIPKGQIIDGRTNYIPPNAIPMRAGKTVKLPLLGAVHAGNPTEPDIIDDYVEVPEAVQACHPKAYCLRVEGDCMDKVYPEGCIIVVDPDQPPHNGSIAAVILNDYDYVMRRLYRGANTMILSPESYNPEHEDIVIAGNDETTVQLVGTVVWFQSDGQMD